MDKFREGNIEKIFAEDLTIILFIIRYILL